MEFYYLDFSSKGLFFLDAIVSNPDEVWQLKIDSIYKPNPLVTGYKDYSRFFYNRKKTQYNTIWIQEIRCTCT